MPESHSRAASGRRVEDAHLKELERILRDFLKYADDHSQHRFCEGSTRLIEESRPIVEQLDAIREQQGRSR